MKYILRKPSSIWEKRIPTILALVLLVGGLGAAAVLVENATILRSGASGSDVPQNLHVSNITNTSFTISYTTEGAALGSISYGKDPSLGTVVSDDRNTSTSFQPYTTHSMTVTNLLPSTTYYFTITSAGKTYLDNNAPYTITTGPAVTTPTMTQQIISGAVAVDGTPTADVLVYLQPQSGQTLSTITNGKGQYSFSLEKLRTTDLMQYKVLSSSDTVTLILTSGTTISHVTTTVGNGSLPPITLGEDYDFTRSSSPITPSTTGTESATPSFGFPTLASPTGLSDKPTILTPQTNQSFSDQQPEFRGLAQPNKTVTITIHSNEAIQTQVTTNANGQWSFRPTTALSPGTHTITISAPDASGIMQTITQSFVVFAAGSQVSQSATPSATIAPTKTPTATPKPTVTPKPTLTSKPTATTKPTPTQLAPTNIPTATFTPSPTPTLVSQIPSPTTPILPPTGNASILPIGIAGVVTTVIGAGIFILTHVL